MAYFPMYVDISEKKCLVVGGGAVAVRKVYTLLDFGAKVEVVAEQISDELIKIPDGCNGRIRLENRRYEQSDCNGMELVVAATDNRELNHEIALHCREQKILVNSVSSKEDSSFIFPAYVKEQDVVAAFSCGGNSPYITQRLKKECQRSLTPFVGELNDLLGRTRELVKASVSDEEIKKRIYRQITDTAFDEERIPNETEIIELINRELGADGIVPKKY